MNQDTPQDPSQYFNNTNFGPWSITFSPSWSQSYQYPMPWQPWFPQSGPNPSWSQNWHGPPPPSRQFSQPMPQQQLQLPSNASTSNPPLRPQLSIQSNPNPNNRGLNKLRHNLPAYNIATAECNELNLRSGWVVNTQTSPIIVEHIDDEVSKRNLWILLEQLGMIQYKFLCNNNPFSNNCY